jgi:hypothetical protein
LVEMSSPTLDQKLKTGISPCHSHFLNKANE